MNEPFPSLQPSLTNYSQSCWSPSCRFTH